jgi:hypothetical protein
LVKTQACGKTDDKTDDKPDETKVTSSLREQ